jgi:hypothetical protein
VIGAALHTSKIFPKSDGRFVRPRTTLCVRGDHGGRCKLGKKGSAMEDSAKYSVWVAEWTEKLDGDLYACSQVSVRRMACGLSRDDAIDFKLKLSDRFYSHHYGKPVPTSKRAYVFVDGALSRDVYNRAMDDSSFCSPQHDFRRHLQSSE